MNLIEGIEKTIEEWKSCSWSDKTGNNCDICGICEKGRKTLAIAIAEKIEIDIEKALKKLDKVQCAIIKDGIDQFGKIGHYGRSFIAKALIDAGFIHKSSVGLDKER